MAGFAINVGQLVVNSGRFQDVSGINSGATISLSPTGVFTFAGTNTFANTLDLNSGTVEAASNNALGTGTLQFNTVGNGYTAELALVGGIQLNNPIILTARNNATVAVANISGTNTLAGMITLQVGGSTYAFQSNAGELVLAGSEWHGDLAWIGE